MKFNDNVLQKIIIDATQKYYGFDIIRAEFLPVGEESYAYKITTKTQENFFVKYCEHQEVIDNIDKINQLLIQLSDLDFVVPPVQANHKTFFKVNMGGIYVYPFIEGEVVRQRNDLFDKDLTDKLIVMVAKIHNSTDKINVNLPRENFENNYLERYQIIEQKHIELWNENKSKIIALIDKHSRQGKKYKNNPPDFVLTHGDVTGLNIIVADSGLKLVDWDGAMFAPKERDYIFFNGNPYFSTPHNIKLREYYTDTWALDSIIGNFESLLSRGTEKADKNDYIEEIKLYLSYYN